MNRRYGVVEEMVVFGRRLPQFKISEMCIESLPKIDAIRIQNIETFFFWMSFIISHLLLKH
jgi:hypothetical protein